MLIPSTVHTSIFNPSKTSRTFRETSTEAVLQHPKTKITSHEPESPKVKDAEVLWVLRLALRRHEGMGAFGSYIMVLYYSMS